MSSEAEIRTYLEVTNDALRDALLEYRSALPVSLINMGKVVLSAPGKVMSAVPLMQQAGGALPASLPMWPLYVIGGFQAAAGEEGSARWREALPGAVAVEIAMAAADLLDELTDDDPSAVIAEYGPGQALNTGNLMLVMAQHTLVKAAAVEVGERQAAILRAVGALQEMLVEAAVGQHLDMLYDKMGPDEVTLEMSLGVTEKKAGALIAGAWRVGALLSGAEGEVVDLLTGLGREIGNIAQVVNDVQDVLPHGDLAALDAATDAPAAPSPKTDLRLRKRTLPIVFTLRDDSEPPNAVQLAFRQPPGTISHDEEALRRAVVEAGGVQFASVVIEVHRQNIEETLARLEAIRPEARELLSHLL